MILIGAIEKIKTKCLALSVRGEILVPLYGNMQIYDARMDVVITACQIVGIPLMQSLTIPINAFAKG